MIWTVDSKVQLTMHVGASAEKPRWLPATAEIDVIFSDMLWLVSLPNLHT